MPQRAGKSHCWIADRVRSTAVSPGKPLLALEGVVLAERRLVDGDVLDEPTAVDAIVTDLRENEQRELYLLTQWHEFTLTLETWESPVGATEKSLFCFKRSARQKFYFVRSARQLERSQVKYAYSMSTSYVPEVLRCTAHDNRFAAHDNEFSVRDIRAVILNLFAAVTRPLGGF